MMTDASYLLARTREYKDMPRLSGEQERALCARWHEERDEEARRRLIEANMRHVVAIARRFRRYPVAYGDLLSEGGLGLVIAIDRFDTGRGVRLVTYASFWIRAFIFQAIIREWKRGKTGLGMTRSKTFFKIRRLLAAQRARYGGLDRNIEQVAAELDVSTESLREMLDHLDAYDLSLEGDWTGDGDGRGGFHERVSDDAPGPEATASQAESRLVSRAAIKRAFRCLDEREKLVASARLMQEEPHTLAELGRRMGVSRERARQIEVRARQKLGRALRREGLSGASVTALFC
jgi:RNA polymerase sigma-32 factor